MSGKNNNKKSTSGYVPSIGIRKRISDWEGASMYSPAPDTGKVNRSFEEEARDFYAAIPHDVRSQMSQDELDALFSTSYNIGSGNFRKRVVPNLINLYRNRTGNVNDVTRSMYGTNDTKYRGLLNRRETERQMFRDAYNSRGIGVFGPTIVERMKEVDNMFKLDPRIFGSIGQTRAYQPSVDLNLNKEYQDFRRTIQNSLNTEEEPMYTMDRYSAQQTPQEVLPTYSYAPQNSDVMSLGNIGFDASIYNPLRYLKKGGKVNIRRRLESNGKRCV